MEVIRDLSPLVTSISSNRKIKKKIKKGRKIPSKGKNNIIFKMVN